MTLKHAKDIIVANEKAINADVVRYSNTFRHSMTSQFTKTSLTEIDDEKR